MSSLDKFEAVGILQVYMKVLPIVVACLFS